MPTVPYYRGGISSGAVAHGPAPQASLLQTLASGAGSGGDALGSLIGRAFYDPEKDPRAQQAAYYKAQAEGEAFKNERATAGAQAAADFGRDSSIIRSFRQLDTPPEMTQRAISDALTRAIAGGADPKQTAAMLRAFGMSLGGDAGDEMSVRINSVLDGKYLNANESPSLARQDFVREDEQKADAEIEAGKRNMEKYGFDTASSDRRYNTDVDAGTQRRGQDVSAGTARRGQNLDFESDRRSRITDTFTSVYNNERDLGGGNGKAVTRIERGADGAVSKRIDQTTRPLPRGGGGRPATAGKDPFPGIAEGQVVSQGGKRYRRQGAKMVPVA